VTSSSTARTTPQVSEASATLKTANRSPLSPKTLIMSTTWPTNGPGARKMRSPRLPHAPPSTSPSAIAQGSEASRRAIQMIHTVTAVATIGKMKV
jgi:hypothetical protein